MTVGGKTLYYDPSYGVTYTSLADFAAKSICAYFVNSQSIYKIWPASDTDFLLYQMDLQPD